MTWSPDDLWEGQKGDFFVIATKSPLGKWKDHFIERDNWDQVDYLLEKYKDHNLYMCPHGFEGSERARLKELSVDPNLLYADLDEADPRKLSLRPTIAIESSPGRYVGYWVTNRPAPEELNRKLAYHIGADVSGWDRTQVLRIPGTRNYKYNPAPIVRLLWKDGPTYNVAKLDKMLPKTGDGTRAPGGDDRALLVYQKYETRLPRWARQELLNGKPQSSGKRSEVLWKLQNALLEAGASTEECFIVLWASVWNKFADRRNGDAQLRKELEKNLTRRLQPGGPSQEEAKPDFGWDPLPRSMAEVEREEIDWLVPSLLARKEITIIEGDPGVGKSYLAQIIAGLICDGKRIPLIEPYKPIQGRVAYFDTENTSGTVTKTRLEENGVVNLSNYLQGEEPFSVDDEERWQKVMDKLSEVRPQLVVFDTVNTYIGSADTHKASETQQAMAFFKEIAREHNCAVVLLRHLTKGGKDKAIYRGQGSIAFTGAARIVATVGFLPDDDTRQTRVVTCTKNNISAFFKSFTYTIDSLPDKPGMKNRSRLCWGELIDINSDEAVSGKREERSKGPTELDKAKALLEELLEEKARVLMNEVRVKARQSTINMKVVEKAISLMEMEVIMDGQGRRWLSRR